MPTPARRPALTREAIVSAATAILDREGPEALSMRTVAAELGCGVMSLYRHVADRDELLDLVLARLVAAITLPPATGRWQDDLAGVARAFRAALVARPQLTPLLTARAGRNQGSLALLDATLAVLRDAGLDPQQAVLAGSALGNLVAGAALQEVAGAVPVDQDEDLAHLAWARPALITTTADERFEFGLRLIIEAIESRTS